MNLETRIRSALDAAAGTIPDHTHPPGLPATAAPRHPRRTWVIAVVAAAAVTAAIAVPYLTQRDRTAPAQTPCPGPSSAPELPLQQSGPAPQDERQRRITELPVGPPPRVPYTLTNGSGAGYLQDGNLRVPLAAGRTVTILDRLHCAWLVTRTVSNAEMADRELGILRSSGDFVPLVRSRTMVLSRWLTAALSPDGSKVAYIAVQGTNRARLVAVDLDSGEEIASRPISPGHDVVGWTPRGVLLRVEQGGTGRWEATLWQPGSTPRKIDTAGQLLYGYRTTDRMLAHGVESSGAHCTRAVTVNDAFGLDQLMSACINDSAASRTLSPDGRILIANDHKARRVPGGEMLPQPDIHAHNYVWEDHQTVLLDRVFDADGHTVVRCNVESGACERVYASAEREALRLMASSSG